MLRGRVAVWHLCLLRTVPATWGWTAFWQIQHPRPPSTGGVWALSTKAARCGPSTSSKRRSVQLWDGGRTWAKERVCLYNARRADGQSCGVSVVAQRWSGVRWCDVVWRHAVGLEVMWRRAMWLVGRCHVMWYDAFGVKWCGVMSCRVMWCDVMWCSGGEWHGM